MGKGKEKKGGSWKQWQKRGNLGTQGTHFYPHGETRLESKIWDSQEEISLEGKQKVK